MKVPAIRLVVVAVVATLGVAGAIAASLVASAGRPLVDDVVIAAAVTVTTVVAVVIEWIRPGHRVGRLMLGGAAAWGVGEGLLALALRGLADAPDSEGFALLGVAGTAVRGAGWLPLVVMVPLVFPDGRPSSRRASALAWTAVGLFSLAALIGPTPLDLRLGGARNPIALPEGWAPVTDVAAIAGMALAFAALVIAIAGLVRRWRQGDVLQRQQLLEFGLAFAPPLLLLLLAPTPWVRPWMYAVAMLPLPVAIGVAILQRRLYDVELAASRALTFGGLSLALAGIYALVVAGVGVTLRDHSTPWVPWVAAGAVAVAFAPLREALQGAANRLIYGRWSAPGDVLAVTARRLADAADGSALLRALTQELVEGLGLRHAEIRDRRGRVLAAAGAAGGAPEQVALTAYGEPVGTLSWTGGPLRARDRQLLGDLAHQLGAMVHSLALVEELRTAQEQLVLAREQERRRLRRDLHDGLGPALAGLGFQVDTIRNLLRDQRPVGEHLDTLRGGLRGTVAEVRRLVDGLRPPALDDLGLFGAVARLGEELAGGAGIAVDLDLPADADGLPAAVEVATYRVAQEALTNVVRHAGAQTCRVRARVSDDELRLEVNDDGHGRNGSHSGVGTSTMRERATEIGGRLVIRDLDPGTCVALTLPLSSRPRNGVPQ